MAMPWSCVIVIWPDSADPRLPQLWPPADILITEQRRSQLTASAWTMASSNKTVTTMDFLSIFYGGDR
jgi:hypothetical protein